MGPWAKWKSFFCHCILIDLTSVSAKGFTLLSETQAFMTTATAIHPFALREIQFTNRHAKDLPQPKFNTRPKMVSQTLLYGTYAKLNAALIAI
ncbi:hypothetical protein ACLOJK_010132 [Asimina triloba]